MNGTKIVERNGKFGLVNEIRGQKIVKQGYTLSDDPALITDSVYEDYSETTQLLPYEYDEIVDVYGTNSFFRVKKNDNVGLFYAEEKLFLLETKYREVELEGVSPIIFKADGKFGGYYKNADRVVLNPIFDEIKTFYSFWAIKLNGMWGLFQYSDRTYLIKPKYHSLDVFDLEKTAYWCSPLNYLVRADQKFGIIASGGTSSAWLELPKHSLKKIEEIMKKKHDLTIKQADRAKLEQDNKPSGGFLGIFRTP